MVIWCYVIENEKQAAVWTLKNATQIQRNGKRMQNGWKLITSGK